MANPIKTSDLYKSEDDILKGIEQLKALEDQYLHLLDVVGKESIKLKVNVQKLNATTSEQREQIKETSKQADEIKRRFDKYNASLGENAVKIAALQNAQRKVNQLNKLEAKLLAAKEGSYDALSAQYSINKIKLNQMSAAEREATAEGQLLVKQSAELYDEMKRLQEETGKHVLNVGNYADASKGLLNQLDQMPGALSGMGTGLKQVSAQMKALLRNPIVLVLSAIVGTLYALFNAFKASEKGARLMEKGSAALSAIWSNMIQLSSVLVDAITSIFENPQKALKSFGQLLIDQVVNRFKAIIDLANAAGASLRAIWERDLAGLKNAANDAATALVQMTTGLDEQQQKDFAAAVQETTKSIIEETNAFIDLAESRLKVKRANRELSRSVEQLRTQEEILGKIADDNTKSFKDREDAAKKAQTALEQRAKTEIQIARNNLSIINKELALRKGNRENVEALLDQQLASYQELAQAERSLTLAVQENEKQRAELKQDRLERDLDILIDGFDNQKTINEKLIQDERTTLEERKNLLEQTKQLADQSFQKQIETIQKFTDVAIDSNDLISTSDAVALNQKIRSLGLSEIIEGRLLEIIRERRIATQDLNDAEIALAQSNQKESLSNLKRQQTIAQLEFDLLRNTEAEKAEFVLASKKAELEAIQQLNDQFDGLIPPINTELLVAEIRKLDKELLKARRETGLALFDEQQKLNQSEFDLLRKTEKEKTLFRLEAEKDRLEKVLELNFQFGGELSSQEIKTIKNQIAAINQEFAKVSRPQSVYELFGLNVTEDEKEALNTSFQFALDQVNQFASRQQEIADRNVQNTSDRLALAQQAFQTETQLAIAGQANRVDSAREELAEAEKAQQQALENQRRAQREQARIQSLQQATNMFTASTKLWADLGLAALPALTIMWGSFLATKVRAAQLSREQYGGGHFETINWGGSHRSGNDVPLGITKDGKERRVERNEGFAVFSKSSMGKYGSVIKKTVESFNNGTFMEYAKSLVSTATDVPVFDISNETDTRRMENELTRIRQQGENKTVIRNGKVVEYFNDHTTIYI